MGNSSSRDARTPPGQGLDHGRADSDTVHAVPNPADRVYSSRNGVGRVSRHDLPFLSMGRDRDGDHPAPERPRETKQEREARRAERDRQARLKERERSMREESVDGGFLVTLGTYTGPEDFNKGIVRQLQIERRLAPFWKGLNDHSASWTEAQLVAAARGLPIPAADEVPPEMARTGSQTSSIPSASGATVQGLTIPVGSRSQSYQTDASANLSASHPAFSSSSNPSSPTAKDYSSSPLFRGRAKTLASLAAGHKNPSSDLAPQEIRLPNDPLVNGQPLEAVLYKDADECPICFMYYPPFLNHTRCCDQPICSECFVQIKRPDPHPPEHEQPGQPRPPEEEAECLVSEVAACPFCVTPEFGVTYEPPSFRRGLAYANHAYGQPFRNPTSATSSNTSLPLGAGRRRATSLSANSSQVITTDRVRPDWAKKLADARAHVLRRAAAATALHNAAYVLGGQGDGQLRAGFNFSRRRRLVNADTTTGGSVSREGEADGDLFSNRTSSRRPRMEDLEEIMMLEAIRLSLAAEEERKRKEEKEAKKKAKKDEKDAKKEEKRAEKLSKRHGSSGSLHNAGADEHTGAWSMARSSSNLGAPPTIPEEQVHGKGKQPVQDFAGFNPLSEPTSTLNDRDFASKKSSSPTDDPQRHLEASRANIQPASSAPISTPTRAPHLRQFSDASSIASSFESAPSSFKGDSSSHIMIPGGPDSIAGAQQDTTGTPRSGTPPVVESMFNFQSLAAMIGEETEKSGGPEHIEHAPASADRLSTADGEVTKFSPNSSPRIAPVSTPTDVTNQTRAKNTTHKSKGKDLGEVSIIDQGQTAG